MILLTRGPQDCAWQGIQEPVPCHRHVKWRATIVDEHGHKISVGVCTKHRDKVEITYAEDPTITCTITRA